MEQRASGQENRSHRHNTKSALNKGITQTEIKFNSD